MPSLELRSVTKDYLSDGQPVRALDDVSLTVERGRFVAVVGRSGCGKSTLLNLSGAIDFPSSGEVLLDGITTSGLDDVPASPESAVNKHVGFIFQSFQLLHTLSAVENVELPLLLAGRPHAREIARERLAWVELEGFADRLPHQLSGGEMQRVAIARALVHSPALLLADEPTGNLDSGTGSAILALLERLTRERGTQQR